MKNTITRRFNQVILYPDIANKFLLGSLNNITLPNILNTYFLYTFSQQKIYNFLAIKALLMISSISPRKSFTSSTLIILKYTKTRYNSFVYLKLNLNELAELMRFFIKKPLSIHNAMRSYISSNKYFIFPGFIKILRLPFWERPLMLCYNKTDKKAQYFLYFYKIAYLD